MKQAPNPLGIIEDFFTMIMEKGWTMYLIGGLILIGIILFFMAKP